MDGYDHTVLNRFDDALSVLMLVIMLVQYREIMSSKVDQEPLNMLRIKISKTLF